MILKWLFDRFASLCGLLIIWPLIIVVVILVKIKMPGGPAFFCQKRVGKDGKLFTCHKFRSMLVAPKVEKGKEGRESREGKESNPSTDSGTANGWSSVSVAGDSRITPFGAKLRHYKIDELPELWDVLIGKMSFVGPRPDVPGYADQLQGDDRVVLKLRPGITGPATLKYRLEDEMIADFVRKARSYDPSTSLRNQNDNTSHSTSSGQAGGSAQAENENLGFALPENVKEMTDQELAVWYNDNVIYPDKVRLNCYYYRHYYRGTHSTELRAGSGLSSLIGLKCLIKDIEMIVATVLGNKISFAGERF